MGYIKNTLTGSEDSKSKSIDLQIKNRNLVVENFNNELELNMSDLEEQLMTARKSFARVGGSDKYEAVIKTRLELESVKEMLEASKAESKEAIG